MFKHIENSFLINSTEHGFLSFDQFHDIKLNNNMKFHELIVPKNYIENINTFKVY